MTKKQKLELTWVGKENRPRLEPRILVEESGLSHHASVRGESDLFDNRLIQGDNLLALKALEAEFAGQVKCVFIDPPYNTGSAFEHYDDGLEHSLWLSMMRDRLELIRRLLRPDGSLWVTLDDNEAHYFKVMCDEVFGRANFIGNIVWEKSDSPRMDAVFLSTRHDHVFVYARDASQTTWNRLTTDEAAAHYDKVDASGRRYYLKPLRAMGGQGDSRAARPTLYFGLTAPDGTTVYPVRQDGSDGAWRWNASKMKAEADRIDWVKGRAGWVPYYRVIADLDSGRPIETIWPHEEVSSNRTSKAEIKRLFPNLTPFSTPKPEKLLHRIIHIATNPGDLVLDSFAGSGTTGAVAHKMGRRWIMVELGEHAHTHIVPRLKKVIDGEDSGGVTAATGWAGGGGYQFYRLAPSLLEYDKWGREVVSKAYNPAMLAEAVCKLEGFTYSPSETDYWNHGHSTEHDFIYVTTQTLTHEQLRDLSEQVGEGRSLLVLCAAYRGDARSLPNLTVKKIPDHVRDRCEWGRDDYSLEIEALPPAPELLELPVQPSGRRAPSPTADLFKKGEA